MNKSEVIKIVEVWNARDVNSYLLLGWRIIETAGGKDLDGTPSVRYSLGWSEADGEIKYPESYLPQEEQSEMSL